MLAIHRKLLYVDWKHLIAFDPRLTLTLKLFIQYCDPDKNIFYMR